MALDYRNAGIDYREADTTYQGVLRNASVSASVVAGVVAVPSPSVASVVTVTPATIAVVAAVPSSTVTGDAGVSASTVAGVGAVPSVSASSTVSVSASTVAGVASVPSVSFSIVASVSATTVAGTASVPSATVAGNASVSTSVVEGSVGVDGPSVSSSASITPASIACSATVPSATISSNAYLAVATVTGVASVPAATASIPTTVTLDPVNVSAGFDDVPIARHVDTGVVAGSSRLAEGERWFNPLEAENRLARFYNPRDRGVNVWIVDNSTVTTRQPVSGANITRVIYGGHTGQDLTEVEAGLLSDAGYRIDIEEKQAA